MAYLYHRVPPAMRGTRLYPLNTLRTILPDLYNIQVKKYDARKSLLQRRILLLDCLWNDVLFLTAIPPADLRRAWEDAKLPYEISLRYYAIDINKLNHSRIAVSTQSRAGDSDKPFEISLLSDYARISAETITHWQKSSYAGERPFLLLYTPHILYKGTIDVSSAPIVEA